MLSELGYDMLKKEIMSQFSVMYREADFLRCSSFMMQNLIQDIMDLNTI